MGSKKQRNPARPAAAGGKGKVVVAFCHGDRVHPQWARNLRAVLIRDSWRGHRIIGEFDVSSSGAHVATGRCKMVRDFLRHDAKPEWLWIVDTDATFDRDVLERMLSAAHPTERPIVGALAFGIKPVEDATGNAVTNTVGAGPFELFPTLYHFNASGQTFRLMDYPQDQLVEVHGTGCHCLLIHRSVLEHPSWDTAHPLPWFRSGTTLAAGEVSEDLFFCLNAKAAGFPIFVDTSIKTGHIKEFVADEDLYLAQREHRPSGRYRRVVVVPSRNPELCVAIVDQLRTRCAGEWDEVAVMWNGDGPCPVDGVTVVPTHGQGIHEMWNWGIDNRDADVAFLNDDLDLRPDCVAQMFEAFYVTAGRVAASCANYDGRPQPPGVDLLEMVDICAGRYDGTGGFAGFCFAVGRAWLLATGYRFPEEAKWWAGDNDLVLSVQQSGWWAVMALQARCTHLDGGGKTGDWADPEMQKQLAADVEWLRTKWARQAVPA